MRSSFREIRVKLAAMNAYLAEHLSGIKVVQLFRRERARRASTTRSTPTTATPTSAPSAPTRACTPLVEAIGVARGRRAWPGTAAASIGDGALTVGSVVAFIEYINKFFIPVRDLSAKYTVMQSAMAAAERITPLLDTDEPDAPASAAGAPATTTRPLPRRCEFDERRASPTAKASRCCAASTSRSARRNRRGGRRHRLGQVDADQAAHPALRVERRGDAPRRPRRPRPAGRRAAPPRSRWCRRTCSCSPAPCARTSDWARPTPATPRSRQALTRVGADRMLARGSATADAPGRRARRQLLRRRAPAHGLRPRPGARSRAAGPRRGHGPRRSRDRGDDRARPGRADEGPNQPGHRPPAVDHPPRRPHRR